MNRLQFIFLLLLVSFIADGQDRYFVFFKDKSNSPFSVADPSKFLSAKSIARRARLNIPITSEDIPVNPNYVAQVKQTGSKTFYTSKWWNGVLIQTDNATISIINNLSFVAKTEFVALGSKLIGGRIAKTDDVSQAAILEASEFQLAQLGIDYMHVDGYRGEGVDIAQFDSGWRGGINMVNSSNPFLPLFSDGRIKDVFNFVTNTTNIFNDDTHGTLVLSTMGASMPGKFTGGAFKANFYLYETEDKLTEYRVEEYNWTFAAERADSIGIDVINSSLGYNTFDDPSMDYKKADMNGRTTVISRAAKKAIDKGIVVVASAGNSGGTVWQTILAPADVDGILAVGAVTVDGAKSFFSSTGPSADGRIKPDVVALGSSTAVIAPDGSLGSSTGTSLAGPLIACLAAGLIQEFPNAKPSEIYKAIINSGSIYTNPTNQLGYGIPNYAKAKSYLKYGQLKDDISVFPNPVINSKLNILIKEPLGQAVSLSIYDLYAKRLLQTITSVDWNTNPIQIDLSSIPNGVYILEISEGGKNVISKIIKAD